MVGEECMGFSHGCKLVVDKVDGVNRNFFVYSFLWLLEERSSLPYLAQLDDKSTNNDLKLNHFQ